MIVTDFGPGWISELVDTVVLAEPVLVGLVTSVSTKDRTSPALAELPKLKSHSTVVPVVLKQSLLSPFPVVVSVSVPPSNDPKLEPVGSATVTLTPG